MPTIRDFVRTVRKKAGTEDALPYIEQHQRLFKDAPIGTQYGLIRHVIEDGHVEVAHALHKRHSTTNHSGYVREWIKRWIRRGRSDCIERIKDESWIMKHGPEKSGKWASFYIERLKAGSGLGMLKTLVDSQSDLRWQHFRSFATQTSETLTALSPYEPDGIRRFVKSDVTINHRILRQALKEGPEKSVRMIAGQVDRLYDDDAKHKRGRTASWICNFLERDMLGIALDEGLLEYGTHHLVELLPENKELFRRAYEQLPFNHRHYGQMLHGMMIKNNTLAQDEILPYLEPRRLEESRYVRGRILHAAFHKHNFGTDNRGAIVEWALKYGADWSDYQFVIERDEPAEAPGLYEVVKSYSNAELLELLIEYDVFGRDELLVGATDDETLYEYWLDRSYPRLPRLLMRQGFEMRHDIEPLIVDALNSFGSPLPESAESDYQDPLIDLVRYLSSHLEPDRFAAETVQEGTNHLYIEAIKAATDSEHKQYFLQLFLNHLPRPEPEPVYEDLFELVSGLNDGPDKLATIAKPLITANVVSSSDWIEAMDERYPDLTEALTDQFTGRRKKAMQQLE